MSDVTIKVSLDDESKKLLKSAIAAASKIGATAASGKGKAKAEEPADDEDAGDDADDFEGGEDDGEADEDGDGEGDGEGEADADEVTQDHVGEALKAYATAKGPSGEGSKALAMKLLKAKGGTDKLSALKPAKFQAVIDACKAATAALKKKKTAK